MVKRNAQAIDGAVHGGKDSVVDVQPAVFGLEWRSSRPDLHLVPVVLQGFHHQLRVPPVDQVWRIGDPDGPGGDLGMGPVQPGVAPIELAGKAAVQNNVPVYILTYLNTLFGYGVESFIEDAVSAGIEGLIIPDLPLEAQQDIRCEYDFGSLTIAAFTSPTSENRLQEIIDGSNGLIYSVNYTGITGSDRSGDVVDDRVRRNYDVLKGLTDRPILSGFGIDGPESAGNAVKNADGVIIGTKLCQICNASQDTDVAGNVFDFLSSIRSAI